jgi:PAS domain S-box-containing protein
MTADEPPAKQPASALLEDAGRFQMLVDAVIDYAIYLMDPTGHINSWNSGAERAKGYAAADVMGRHFSMFFTEEDRRAGRPAQALEEAARTGRFESEGWRVRKDGSRFWASTVVDRILDKSGHLVGFAKITRDITEKRKAQMDLDHAREQLFQAQKLEALGQLTGGVAHDFNNLLAAILSGVSLMERLGNSNERQRQVMSAMRKAARRGEAMTKQLLSFSRRQPARPEIVALSAQFDELSSLLERLLSGDIRVNTDIPGDIALLEIDPGQLELALVNLCLNARDAMPDGGALVIKARDVVLPDAAGCERPFVKVSVSDTGTGIPETIRAKIFEPFFTTKEVGKGSGLGLSQVYGFASQAGGSVEVESEVGHGTTIALILPAAGSNAGVAGGEADGDPKSDSAVAGTILMVEDDIAVAELTSALLEYSGYTVRVAHTGAEAIDLLRRSDDIDAVFSDIAMPGGMSGIDLARLIRADFPAIPVLLTTGFGQQAWDLEEAGIRVLPKPYDPDDVIKIINELLVEVRRPNP